MAYPYALRVNMIPTSGMSQVTVGSAASTAGSISFGQAVRVAFVCDVDTYIAFGDTSVSAPTTSTSGWLPANQWHVWDRPSGTGTGAITNARVLRKGSSNGKLAWGVVA